MCTQPQVCKVVNEFYFVASPFSLHAAHHCFAGKAWWPRVNQGTTLNRTSGSALAETSARLSSLETRGGGGGDS